MHCEASAVKRLPVEEAMWEGSRFSSELVVFMLLPVFMPVSLQWYTEKLTKEIRVLKLGTFKNTVALQN